MHGQASTGCLEVHQFGWSSFGWILKLAKQLTWDSNSLINYYMIKGNKFTVCQESKNITSNTFTIPQAS